MGPAPIARALWPLALCACEASIGMTGAPGSNPDGMGPDAAGWSAPRMVPGAGTGVDEDDATPHADVLEMIFSYEEAADNNRKHLYAMTRTSAAQDFVSPQRLPFNVTGASDQTPRLSADGLTLYFASTRDPNTTGLDVWQVTRPSIGGAWGTPSVILELVDPDDDDKWFSPCANGRYLMISDRAGNDDVYEGVLGQGPPVRVAELSSASGETGTWVSQDCTLVYFASTRSGANRIYTATRPAAGMPWSTPAMVTDFLALGGDQEDPWISPDRKTFMFVSDVSGNKDVYISTRN